MRHYRNQRLLSNARNLRKNMTRQERRLWYDCLRYIRPRFRRQEIIGDYIADFFCSKAQMIIEVDGSQHYEDKGLREDSARTTYFHALGIKVLRFSNKDVDTRFNGVAEAILLALQECGINANVDVEGDV